MENLPRTTRPAITLKYMGEKLVEEISNHLSNKSFNRRLLHACVNGEEDVVLKLRPQIQEINDGELELYGMKPLHFACLFGHWRVVDILLELGADVNVRVEKTLAKETALHIAAGKNYVKIVKVLLANGADPNTVASNHLKTPLHVASDEGHLETVQVLLQGGAVNDVPRPAIMSTLGSWCTALHLACQKGHLDIVEVLLKHGASVDSVCEDPRGLSVLHEAVSNHRVAVVKYLINERVKVNVFDKSGFSPLHVAAKNGDVEMIELLIQSGSEVDLFLKDPMHTPLISSIVSGKCESIVALLKAGGKVDGILNDASPLYQAIRCDNDNLHIVKILISFGANEHIPDELGFYPLHNAASWGNRELVEFFLERGHDPGKLSMSPDDVGQQETALHSAVLGDSPSVVRLLVSVGVSVNCLCHPGVQTSIYYSILNKNIEMTELLIELGANINVKDAAGITPLHHAIVSHDDEIIKVLIHNGASLEAKTLDGLTPLLSAAIEGTPSSVILLIELGASINETSIYGETPLHFAAELNYIEKAIFFLQNGANVNSVDRNGASPLHLAAANGHDEIVELLCTQNETKVDIKDSNDVTPLHLAAFNGYEKAVQILLKAGANRRITLNGESAADISCRRGFLDVTRHLKEFEVLGITNTEDAKEAATTVPDSSFLPSYLQSVLETDGVGILLPEAYQYVTITVTSFIQDLLKAVEKLDPRFVSQVTLSGSNAESCKVGKPDEFDFMFFLPNLAKEFEFSQCAKDPAGYFKVKLKKDRSTRSMYVDDLLKKGTGNLFPQRIKAILFSHIEDIFLLKKIKVPQEIRAYLEEFLQGSGKHRIVSENKPGCVLYFEWRHGLYTGMQITVDLIPTLPFDCPEIDMVQTTPQARNILSKTRKDSSTSKGLESEPFLYLIPKPTAESSEDILWRISTSRLETQILQGLPDCKRNAYILGKILLEQTGKVPQRGIEEYGLIEYYIHTYLLKTTFLHEVARVPEDSSWLSSNVVIRLTDIFRFLKKSIETNSLLSFFIENYDILRDDDDRARKTARIWIVDAVLRFLSDRKYSIQGSLKPRDLHTILHSLRSESI